MIRYEDNFIARGVETSRLADVRVRAESALEILQKRSGAGNDFLGWLDLPLQTKEMLTELGAVAQEIHDSGALLVCIGIGGSYLGAKAVLESLWPGQHKIRFIGHHLSPLEMNRLLKELDDQDFYVNVISKSGTTTEPGVAFRIMREYTEKRYGKHAARRIIATTDAKKGALRSLAGEKGYRCFVIPDDVGGRFSVLTPVGLLPILAAGASLGKILAGARRGLENSLKVSTENMSLRYAVNRLGLYESGKQIEILANFEPQLHFIAEWWKQLYGESEGKGHQGLFPASVDFTTDLHSMGQWIQDGVRSIFETFLIVENYEADILIPRNDDDADQLNFVAGRTLSYVNQKAYEGTREAHLEGGVPSSAFIIEKLDEESLFELLVIFEVGVALSAYMAGVNPFDQPGVEAYKKNMFRLLGKTGY